MQPLSQEVLPETRMALVEMTVAVSVSSQRPSP